MRIINSYVLVFFLLYPWVGGILNNCYSYFYLPDHKINIEADVFYDMKNNRGGARGLTFVLKGFPVKDRNVNLPIGTNNKYYDYFKDQGKYSLTVIYKENHNKYLTFSRDYFFIAAYGNDGYFVYKPSIAFFLTKNLLNIIVSFSIIFIFLFKRVKSM